MTFMKAVFYPGSFDPITYGHMSIIEQAANIFDKVIVGVAVNFKKNSGMFNFEERKNMIKEIYQNQSKIEVIAVPNDVASVDIAFIHHCDFMIRGLRDLTDYNQELNLAQINSIISKGKIHTIALFADPTKITISSTMVKELFRLNKEIDDFVPEIVKKAMIAKQNKEVTP